MIKQNEAKVSIRQFSGDMMQAKCRCTVKVIDCSLSEVIVFTKSHTGPITYEITNALIHFVTRYNLVTQFHEVCEQACQAFDKEYGIECYRKFPIEANSANSANSEGIAK